jgi:hypothetical protein
MLVQAVEHRTRHRQHLDIGQDHGQAAADHIQPDRFRRVEAVVGEIGLVHDPSDIPEDGVVQPEVSEHRLERAASLTMRKLDPPHVERSGVGRHLEHSGRHDGDGHPGGHGCRWR